jgi:hypothetical protein
MKKILLATLFLTSLYVTTPAFAALGNSSGGGGTIISSRFVAHGEFALEILKYSVKELTQEKIDQVIEETKVFDVQDLCYQDPNNGAINCLDAKYNSELEQIDFSRKSWANFKCNEKLALAAHEYLRALGIEGSNYQYSYLLISGKITNDIRTNNGLVVLIQNWCAQN